MGAANTACLGQSRPSNTTTTEDVVPTYSAESILAKQYYRPKRMILVRHGQSEGNVRRSLTKFVPDHELHLTAEGREQALKSGENLKSIIGDESVIFIYSPYVRTVETLNGLTRSFGGREATQCKEDAYIREQDFGNFDKPEMREYHVDKQLFGKFYYRFPDGESPADVYSRAGIFLESLYRRWEMEYVSNVVIVSHELFILVFLMRFFRYPVQEYYSLEGLSNGCLVVLERPDDKLLFEVAYTWSPGKEKEDGGLKKKPADQVPAPCSVWDGNPDSELVNSIERHAEVKARRTIGS